MPLINFSFTKGAIEPERVHSLVSDLLAILLRNHILSNLAAQLAPVTCFKVFEVEPRHYFVAGNPTHDHRYDIEIIVPEGTVDGERRDRIVLEMTQAVLSAAETEWSEDAAHRVWVLIRDVPDGRWAVGGRIVTAKTILKYLLKARRAMQRNQTQVEYLPIPGPAHAHHLPSGPQ